MEDDWYFMRLRLLFMFYIVVNRIIDYVLLIKIILIYSVLNCFL